MFRLTENTVELIKKISQKKAAGNYPNFINFIAFPFYKNFVLDTKITFDFPVTALVGLNGTGKSSILHALRGCVLNKTPERYWFDTPLDPILEQEASRRPFLFYEYTDEQKINREVAKARRTRKDNPDYWETTVPAISYNMKDEGRNSPVEKETFYINFKTQLSAFDSYLLYNTKYNTKFGDVSSGSFRKKKDYIRSKSTHLKNVMISKKINQQGSTPQNKVPEEFNQEMLNDISIILGRSYKSGAIIKHKFFKDWGYSIFLSNDFRSYTDAMAGSGETSVALLVYRIHKAPNSSLILLDEPEISIHPGAQKRLQKFLLKKSLEKNLQIVLSTHSPSMLDSLPEFAIKKLSANSTTGKIECQNSCRIEEAFQLLEIPTTTTCSVYLEDDLAVDIFSIVLEELYPELLNEWHISKFEGGAKTILKSFVPSLPKLKNSSVYIVLDGDQKPKSNYIKSADFTVSQSMNLEFLQEQFFIRTGIKEKQMSWFIDGSKGKGNSEQKVHAIKNYIDFFDNNIMFLPGEIPEDIIWNVEYLKKLYPENPANNKPESNHNKKKLISMWAEGFSELTRLPKTSSQKAIQGSLIKGWVQHSPDNNFSEIKKIITRIKLNNNRRHNSDI